MIDFPSQLGHIPVMLMGVDENRVFALKATRDIPQARIRAGDYMICDFDKRPQPGDIALLPFGKRSNRQFLCRIIGYTSGDSKIKINLDDTDIELTYPIPEFLLDPSDDRKLKWKPIGLKPNSEDRFIEESAKDKVTWSPIPPNLAFATVLRLYRQVFTFDQKQTQG